MILVVMRNQEVHRVRKANVMNYLHPTVAIWSCENAWCALSCAYYRFKCKSRYGLSASLCWWIHVLLKGFLRFRSDADPLTADQHPSWETIGQTESISIRIDNLCQSQSFFGQHSFNGLHQVIMVFCCFELENDWKTNSKEEEDKSKKKWLKKKINCFQNDRHLNRNEGNTWMLAVNRLLCQW